MPDALVAELARQGLGYLLAVIEGFIILFLLRRGDQKDATITAKNEIIVQTQEKRITDFKDTSEKFITVGKDLVAGMNALKETNQVQTSAIIKTIDGIKKKKP